MLIDIQLLNTVMALICTCGLYTLVSMARSLRETERINRHSIEALEHLQWYKAHLKLVDDNTPVNELSPEHLEHFGPIAVYYQELIRDDFEMRSSLLRLLSKQTGRNYSVIEMQRCFNDGVLNRFFIDLAYRGDYLYSNIVGLQLLKKHGYNDKYRHIMEESGLV
ncbi:hypothetical protein [Limisalsivibrio acetivorans]|uniref:hypothetical protein n=1 Tax=Limisalsivibrio acetivorans TaxID=1304888 RepID=UPI0003B53955|nr:hypothetical protein [Limisalsivibrio acetivorans]